MSVRFVEIPDSTSPCCGWQNHSYRTNIPPQPGEAEVCIGCGAIFIRADNLQERLPTDEEIQTLQDNGEWDEIEARWLPVEGQASGAAWQLVEDAEARYEAFKGKVTK